MNVLIRWRQVMFLCLLTGLLALPIASWAGGYQFIGTAAAGDDDGDDDGDGDGDGDGYGDDDYDDDDQLQIRKDKVVSVYERLIKEKSLAIMALVSEIENPNGPDYSLVDDLFAPDAKVLVYPSGLFGTLRTVVDYFYATGSVSDFQSVDFVHLVAEGNKVAFKVKIGAEIATLWEEGTFLFNDDNLIVYGDLSLPGLGAAQDATFPVSQNEFARDICQRLTVEYPDPFRPGQTRPALCAYKYDTLDDFLGAASQEFVDNVYVPGDAFNNCVNFLTTEVPMGSFDRLGTTNTTFCRYLHELNARFGFVEHCEHASPKGLVPGKCVFDYNTNEDYLYFLEQSTSDGH